MNIDTRDMLKQRLDSYSKVARMSKFDKRLLIPIAAGAALLPIQPALGAVVVYNNGGSIVLTGGTASQPISFAGQERFQVYLSSTSSASLHVKATNIATCGWLGTDNKVNALNLNDYIGPGGGFRLNDNWGPLTASFDGAGAKYAGFKFNLGANTHYGWIKLNLNLGGGTLTINEWAYEDTPDLGINAGSDQSLPVELSSFTASQAKGAINISWITESETDNLGFILERQLKGETNWATIASYKTHTQLAGQGNKTSQTKYNFADKNVQSGNTYLYRLTDIDINGNVSSRHVITVNTTDIVLPDKTELLSAYPNPFNPGTSIEYRLEADSDVTLSVIDITGRTVQTLVTENQSAGSYTSSWDGLDNAGQPTPSGLYILVLKAGNNITTQKVTRIR